MAIEKYVSSKEIHLLAFINKTKKKKKTENIWLKRRKNVFKANKANKCC